jgi:hypothetical protein
MMCAAMPKRQRQPVITATEVAEFMFCAKAWQLKREGNEPDSSHLEPGVAFHRRHGKRLTFAQKLQRAGWGLVVLALLLLLILLLRLS